MIDRETRRNLIILLCVLVLWAVIAAALAAKAGAQAPVVGKHLFVDVALVDEAQSSNYMFALQPPTNIKRILSANKPWENLGFYHFQPVVRDLGDQRFEGGRYVMAYPAWSIDETGQTAVHEAVAVSNDGINWRKPTNIDGTRFGGQASNLVTMPVSIGDLQHHQSYDPATGLWYRTGEPDGRLAITHSSADGIHWTELQPPLYLTEKPYGSDGTRNFFRTADGRYLWFLRGWTNGARSANLSQTDDFRQLQWTDIANPDLHWPNANPPQYAITGEVPLLAQADAADWADWNNGRRNGVQIYRWLPEQYEDIYITRPWLYHLLTATTERRGLGTNDGDFDSEFAVSRDGINWTRYRTPTYLPRDSGELAGMYMVLSATNGLRVGDTYYEYFLALPKSKRSAWIDGAWGPYLDGGPRQRAWLEMDQGGVYVAEQRVDGFVALQPTANKTATVITLPFRTDGGRLTVNHVGPVLADVLRGDTVITSRSLAGDSLRAFVADLTPGEYRLRLTLAPTAKLFAFEIAPGQVTSTPTAQPTSTPTAMHTPVAGTATPTPTPAANLLASTAFFFASDVRGERDGYRIVVETPGSSACWHGDIPAAAVAGRTVRFGGSLWRSADMGDYAPYLSLQVRRAQAWAYNVGGTLRHTAAPGEWQAVSRTIDIPADARQVRASFCVWRAQPGTTKARDLTMEISQ